MNKQTMITVMNTSVDDVLPTLHINFENKKAWVAMLKVVSNNPHNVATVTENVRYATAIDYVKHADNRLKLEAAFNNTEVWKVVK